MGLRQVTFIFVLAVYMIMFWAGKTPLAAEKIKLTSLEWPPYSGKYLKNQGFTIERIKRLFRSVGYEVKVDFFPWRRAVKMGLNNPEYVGVVPEYYAKARDHKIIKIGGCRFSEPFGYSPVGFATKESQALIWSSHADLMAYTFGVVSGYVNETKFDNMIERGAIRASNAGSDKLNLLKVLSGRIQAAVIDRNVFNYLMENDPDLKAEKEKLIFHQKLLSQHDLYICFSSQEHADKAEEAFQRSLNR